MISFFKRKFLRNRKLPNKPRIIYYTTSKLQILKWWLKNDFVNILDVGCGNGIFVYQFENHYAQVIGLDKNWSLLKEGKKFVNSSLICASTHFLPFKNNTFDLIMAINLLHHVDSPLNAVKEMSRVSNQYLYIIEPNRTNPFMAMYIALNKKEQSALHNSKRKLESYFKKFQLKIIKLFVGGTITPNLTPKILLFLVKWINQRSFRLGFYLHYILEKVAEFSN